MITKARAAALVSKFGGSEKNSGKTEVQIAILTERITNLTDHFSGHTKDHSSKRGLMKMIGRRRRLLKYLNEVDTSRYQAVIKELGLRK